MTARIPRATYRLQLHAGFTFEDAQEVLGYLDRLGVSDVYTSPPFQAVTGSTHGYNLVSYETLSTELGGEDAFRALAGALAKRGMGMIVDFVPNHMGIANGENAMWEDVLENGQSSRFADFFDIEWQPLKRSLSGKVLLPTLGDQYGVVLERGELRLVRQGGRIFLAYYDRRFPVSPRSLAPLLDRAEELTGLSEDDWDRLELASIATQARNLPHAATADPAARVVRAREKEVLKRRLRDLSFRSEAIGSALDAALAEWNSPEGIEKLDALIRDQNYRLAFWRIATEEINYRRFFDINDLAAIRMEDSAVFESAHRLLMRLIDEGLVTGVRLDHTDGLYDPLGYFRALQECRAKQTGEDAKGLPLYLLAEKILESGEHLPDRWPIHGTTGYDFLAQLNGLWVRTEAAEEMSAIYRRYTGENTGFSELVYQGKRLIMRSSLSSEVAVLAERLERLAESDRRSRDFTLTSLRTAITELIASFPVYRTYVRPDGTRERADNAHIDRAVRLAKRRNRDLSPAVFDFLGDVLKLRAAEGGRDISFTDFALKFQQATGPVTAKGVEDTSFYLYNRLVSLNEVGGDPAIFGTTLEAFHKEIAGRVSRWPQAMLATSTHDTKRGEDTRARISLLSEIPDSWMAYLSTWGRVARQYTVDLDGERAPDLNDEYLFYQTVLGSWPLDANFEGYTERIVDYLHKAIREAKRHTSWTNQNTEYEDAIANFARGMLEDQEFKAGIEELHTRLSPYGAQNGLSSALVKLTAPGVPDTYQGCEVWNQSLVDPDNRRPVDYARLNTILKRVEKAGAEPLALAAEFLQTYQDGAVKLLVTHLALQARRDHEALFRDGDYQALDAGEHIVAYARTLGRAVSVTVAPRFTLTLTGEQQAWALGEVWGDAELPLPVGGKYRNVLTGEIHNASRKRTLKLREVLREFPLALLVKA
ncbi:malto-oligosyltrehalose synthase [Deinococcus peraridilitoris]|uniref:Malto-oligosyltrehalose synthase n=1 Tax=Deinococcus peraridilitoris (strain DSM 19664 / LMG 22246 / CIP 109416 / KR-200) TaxID=937777 RepID=L0A754_DEIPD|nr:malto-oligosyltrehalose synthase [Deinococcus peraridilitoris]AFZ69017.1 malto-oligosyltrehalose synthase [Deinococcus peraridilitoris DSM 19664]